MREEGEGKKEARTGKLASNANLPEPIGESWLPGFSSPSLPARLPLVSTLGIVGVGLMGGALGMAARQRGVAQTVVGIGRNPETLQRAVTLGAIDTFTTDLAEGVADADIVVLATPIPLILRDLARLPSLLKPDALVTDMGSVKGEIVETGERHLPGQFVGSHPMCGSEKSGVEAAHPDLFVGATWVLTPTEKTTGNAFHRIAQLARGIGAVPLVLSPGEHDRTVAVTSHLPHLLAYALASVAGKNAEALPHLFAVAAGSFASGTRVAHSSPELWRDICSSNRDALLLALTQYQRELSTLFSALEEQDTQTFYELLEQGHLAVQARTQEKQ